MKQLLCFVLLVVLGHHALGYQDSRLYQKRTVPLGENCPDGYVEIGTQCMIMINTKMNWDQSKAACVENSAQLTSLKDPMTLRDYVIEYFPKSSFWVGGRYYRNPDGWQWVSGAPFNSSFPWGINDNGVQQNKGENQDCLILRYFPIQDEQEYVDNRCDKKNYFICEKPKVKRDECYYDRGHGFPGKLTVTEDGIQCQRWDSQHPHNHGNHIENAENYCRNPDNELRPWCYTMNKDIRWQFCDIPKCDKCYYDRGQEYTGKLTVTEDGIQCQRWDSQQPHNHGNHIENAENYCRNPDNSERPWCYTMNKDIRWQFCDIPNCETSFSV